MAECSSLPSRSLCFCCTWCIDLLYSLYWLTNLARLLIFCFVCLGSLYLSATIATLQQAAAIAHENPPRPCKPLLEEHLYNESPEPAPRQKQKLQKAVTHAEGIQKHGMQAIVQDCTMKKTESSNRCGLFPLHQRLECFLESWSSTRPVLLEKWSANGCPCPLSLTSTSRQKREPCHSRHSHACLICVGFGAWNDRDQTLRMFRCILKIRCILHLPETCAILFVPTCMDPCGQSFSK